MKLSQTGLAFLQNLIGRSTKEILDKFDSYEENKVSSSPLIYWYKTYYLLLLIQQHHEGLEVIYRTAQGLQILHHVNKAADKLVYQQKMIDMSTDQGTQILTREFELNNNIKASPLFNTLSLEEIDVLIREYKKALPSNFDVTSESIEPEIAKRFYRNIAPLFFHTNDQRVELWFMAALYGSKHSLKQLLHVEHKVKGLLLLLAKIADNAERIAFYSNNQQIINNNSLVVLLSKHEGTQREERIWKKMDDAPFVDKIKQFIKQINYLSIMRQDINQFYEAVLMCQNEIAMISKIYRWTKLFPQLNNMDSVDIKRLSFITNQVVNELKNQFHHIRWQEALEGYRQLEPTAPSSCYMQ